MLLLFVVRGGGGPRVTLTVVGTALVLVVVVGCLPQSVTRHTSVCPHHTTPDQISAVSARDAQLVDVVSTGALTPANLYN